MAIELCSEKSSAIGVNSSSSNNTTPRISFSYEFLQSDVVPIEQRPLRSPGLNSSIDFDFCVHESFDQESSSADELFSDGKILPTDQIKKKTTTATTTTTSSVDHTKVLPDPQTDHQTLPQTYGVRDENNSKGIKKETSSESRSFWRFKRSSSCGSGYGRTLCPLPLLSRSNSTGSADETKPINIKREGANSSKQNSQKQNHFSARVQCHSTYSYQKPPLKKVHGAYGNGVPINPVLNVPPANLFAIGSIFSNSKNGKTKKK